MKFNTANLAVAVLSLLVTSGGVVWTVFDKISEQQSPLPEDVRFHCTLKSYGEESRLWTVMYHTDKEAKPWLKIVTSLGEKDPKQRCREIASRLEMYRQDGLRRLDYRDNPTTPGQAVVCAYTRLSGTNCPLIITLQRGANPYETFRAITAPLRDEQFHGAVYQSSDGKPQSVPRNNLSIELGSHLRAEDRDK